MATILFLSSGSNGISIFFAIKHAADLNDLHDLHDLQAN